MKIRKLHQMGSGGKVIIAINIFLMCLVLVIIGLNTFFKE
tara:strand:+ start:47 stop:166 length:120 start_codon:yes stop_codon:yes gene_type:complete